MNKEIKFKLHILIPETPELIHKSKTTARVTIPVDTGKMSALVFEATDQAINTMLPIKKEKIYMRGYTIYISKNDKISYLNFETRILLEYSWHGKQ